MLRRKLAWMIGVRAVTSTALLGGAVVAQIRAPGSFPVDPFFFLIALTYALTVVFAATLRFAERHRWLVDVQLTADALIVSAFIYVTGGITSFFSLLYVLPVVAASTVRFRRGGLYVATISGLGYVVIVLAQYMARAGLLYDSWLSGQDVILPPGSVAQYTVALNLFGFYAVALLSGSLAENVRSAGVRLEQASTEIADLQALNQHVIDSLPSGLATTDTAQRILTFNHAAEAITGAACPAVVGRPIAEVLQLPEAVARQLDGGLTDVKKLEREARIQQRLAAVGEMAAGIAHEIRNPLASMSGSIQILRQELPLSAEQEQLMDIVLRESERLNTTIRSFLAYARPQRFAIARHDVRRALNDTALLLRNSVELKEGHLVDVDVPDDELWYEADEGQIKQIIWNLATNGLRAMPDGGRLRLSGTVEPESEAVVITVEDQGIGIPADALDGLFQPFHGSFAKGSGLGLAIVHRIVTDYHGEIQVSSKPGAGTRVSVRLPARVAVTT